MLCLVWSLLHILTEIPSFQTHSQNLPIHLEFSLQLEFYSNIILKCYAVNYKGCGGKDDMKLYNYNSITSFWLKKLSLCHKIPCRKSLIFQTYIIWSNRIHSLKYLRSTTLEFKDVGFRKAEFVAKTQFLLVAFAMILKHSPLKPTISSVSGLQITAGWQRKKQVYGCRAS